jgi:hypothetical protein
MPDIVWGHAKDVCGIFFCIGTRFIAAGGCDEIRIYGPEDRDLNDRLGNGGKFGLVPGLDACRTPDDVKVSNFSVARRQAPDRH